MALLAESKLSPGRLGFLRYATVVIFLGLLTGFWQLQVVRSDYYANLAERNRIRTLPVMAPRGLILDREGRTLVEHYTSFSVILVRDYVEEVKDDLPRIAEGLGLETDALAAKLEENADAAPFQPIVLKEEATLADIAFIEAHRTDLPQLELLLVYRRRYPPDGYGAHLFGYVGEASRREIEKSGFALGDVVGKMGVERYFNENLMGRNGQRRVIVDSRGKEVEKLDRVNPIPGHPLRLTIDADVQQAAETALQGRKGAIVALDPRTGDILALTSHPNFDPNLFAVSIPPEEWRALTEDPDKPLLDRAIQAQLSPGSVFKILIAAAALEEGVIDKDHFTVYCPGYANHYGRVFRCWRPGGHGTVNLHRAIVESCDVFFYEVGRKLGIERISRYAKMLGLGALTGIDLPGEQAGLVPSSEWKQRTQKEPWYDGETISVAIGQGPLLVTPLQLAYMVGGIATGGHFAKPHLLYDPDAEPAVHNVGLRPETVKEITAGLSGVVNEEGTGRSARLAEVEVGGKTGTAQLVSLDARNRARGESGRSFVDNAWFVGLAPARDPEIVVTVLVEHGEHGANVAPLARDVIKAYFDKRLAAPRPEVARAPAPSVVKAAESTETE